MQFAGSYKSVNEAIYTSAQAVTLGVPAIDIESGELGIVDNKYSSIIRRPTCFCLEEALEVWTSQALLDTQKS